MGQIPEKAQPQFYCRSNDAITEKGEVENTQKSSQSNQKDKICAILLLTICFSHHIFGLQV